MATKRRGIKAPRNTKVSVVTMNGFTTLVIPATDKAGFVICNQLANRLAIDGRQEESNTIRAASEQMRKEYLDFATGKAVTVEATDSAPAEAVVESAVEAKE